MRAPALLLLLVPGCLLAGQDGGTGPGSDDPPPPDGGGMDVICRDDTAFEPNDTISSAFITPVAEVPTFNVAGALCPEGDVNLYRLELFGGGGGQLFISFEPGGDPLDITLLDAAGNPLAFGVPESSFTARACLESASGIFFARVFSDNTFAKNNYNLEISAVPSCF